MGVKQTEAMKAALTALKSIDEAMPFPVAKFAIRQLEEALAEQPAQQEPVAYSYTSRITGAQGFSHHPMPRFIDSESWDIKPLYTQQYTYIAPTHQKSFGWKLVPIEPTNEMLKAMDECSTEGYDERLLAGHASSVYMAAVDVAPTPPKPEPVIDKSAAWISVKEALPKAVRGVSYKQSLTDVVLVRHSDRPDYPITAHAVVGEGLGAGVAIPTDGASEHPEIAWYSASSDLNNPFGLKNDDYERYLPRIFGSKITHWMPITTIPASKP